MPSRLAAAALVALLSTALVAALLDPAGDARPPRAERVPAGRDVRFSLALRGTHQAALRRLLARGDAPELSPRRFGRRFGPSGVELRRVWARLDNLGVDVLRTYPQRTAMLVRADAEVVESLFETELREVDRPGGAEAHFPLRRPTVPTVLRPAVASVLDLDTRIRPQPADVPSGGLSPVDMASAYEVSPLHADGVDGTGATVAIVSFAAFHPEDVDAYADRFGLDGPDPVAIPVLGGPDPVPSAEAIEASLDVEVVKGIAPRAKILSYQAPRNARIGQVVDEILADGRADVISVSYGLCELGLPRSYVRADQRAFAAAQASGVSVFVASGDSGAYECQRSDPSDLQLSVGWPAASPSVVAVGGTKLSVRTDGSYLEESGWRDVLSRRGSGGGLSTLYRRPAWQSGPGVRNESSNGGRQVPDVSAAADPASGYFVIHDLQPTLVGGTSGAAPFWAASWALIRQRLEERGLPAPGFAAPLLYELPSGAGSPLHDVTSGGNRFYPATPGWDYATGLGSPDVAALADALGARR